MKSFNYCSFLVSKQFFLCFSCSLFVYLMCFHFCFPDFFSRDFLWFLVAFNLILFHLRCVVFCSWINYNHAHGNKTHIKFIRTNKLNKKTKHWAHVTACRHWIKLCTSCKEKVAWMSALLLSSIVIGFIHILTCQHWQFSVSHFKFNEPTKNYFFLSKGEKKALKTEFWIARGFTICRPRHWHSLQHFVSLFMFYRNG